MNIEELKEKFGKYITMYMAWDKLISEGAIVDVVHLAGVNDLKSVHTAWYYPQEETGTDFADKTKTNLTVGAVAENLGLVAADRGSKIENLIPAILNGECTLEFPVYALPQSEFFLLDGNHRAVAAAICQAGPVTLYVIAGRRSSDILLDLWRWQSLD